MDWLQAGPHALNKKGSRQNKGKFEVFVINNRAVSSLRLWATPAKSDGWRIESHPNNGWDVWGPQSGQLRLSIFLWRVHHATKTASTDEWASRQLTGTCFLPSPGPPRLRNLGWEVQLHGGGHLIVISSSSKSLMVGNLIQNFWKKARLFA